MIVLLIHVVVLMLLNVNIDCGVQRTSAACLEELKPFVVSKTTSNVSLDSMRICTTTITALKCCNRPMENVMKTHVNKQVTQLITDRNTDAKRKIDAVYISFKRFSENVLYQTSESAVKYLQTQSAITANIADDAAPYIRTFFTGLQEYFTRKETKTMVENTTNTFFKDFFPPFYRKNIIKHKTEFPADFTKCLKDKAHLINPFLNVPRDVNLVLKRDLSTIRSFLHGLRTTAQVLEDINKMNLSDNCSIAMVMMTHCSLCSNLSNMKPCPGYCMDTMSKCLKPYSDIQTYWEILINALNDLSLILPKFLDATKLFRKLQEKLSNAMSNAFLAKDKVSMHCGSIDAYGVNKIVRLKHKQKDAPTHEHGGDFFISGDSQNIYANLPTRTDAEEELRKIISILLKHKNFFGNVSHNVCENETFNSSNQSDCWNGTNRGRYDANLGIRFDMKPNNSVFLVKGVLHSLQTARQDIDYVLRENDDDSSSGELFSSASGSGEFSGDNSIGTKYEYSGDCDDSDDCGSTSSGIGENDLKPLKTDESLITEEPTEKSTTPTADAAKCRCNYLLMLLIFPYYLFIWR